VGNGGDGVVAGTVEGSWVRFLSIPLQSNGSGHRPLSPNSFWYQLKAGRAVWL